MERFRGRMRRRRSHREGYSTRKDRFGLGDFPGALSQHTGKPYRTTLTPGSPFGHLPSTAITRARRPSGDD